MELSSSAPVWILLAIVFMLMAGGIIYVARLNLRLRAFTRVLRDEITERRRAEERLAENDARLRQIIDSEPECVKLQNLDGMLLEMNPAGLALMEASRPQQIIGTSVYQMIAPEFHEDYRALTARVFAGESGVMEFQIISLKGRRRWMETHAVPLRGKDGEVVALLGITRDITARKLAEDGVRLHYRELAHAARINTMGEMASGLAHELNQPLAAIANYSRGCLHRIRSGNGNVSDLIQALEQMCNQANRAAEIINSLRHFVHKRDAERRLEDLHAIIREVMVIARPEVNLHRVGMHMDLSPNMPPVPVHAIQIEQVILNLIRNAVEAVDGMPQTRRYVSIHTYVKHDNAVLEVRDCGPGFPEDMQFRLFEPFFTTKDTGMGMGLPISRSIVEAHGGELKAMSNDNGMGLCMRVILPLDTEVIIDERSADRICGG